MTPAPLQRGGSGDLLTGMTDYIEKIVACGVTCHWRYKLKGKTVWRSGETRYRAASGEPGVTVRVERWAGDGHEYWTVTRSVSFRERDGLQPTGLRRLYAQLVGEGRTLEEAEEQCVMAEDWLGDAGSDDG